MKRYTNRYYEVRDNNFLFYNENREFVIPVPVSKEDLKDESVLKLIISKVEPLLKASDKYFEKGGTKEEYNNFKDNLTNKTDAEKAEAINNFIKNY